MVGFDVRNMRKNDLEGVVKLNNNIDLSTFYPLFKKNKYKVIVAQLNDDIVGYVNFEILNEMSCENAIYINEILVDELYRGLGVGHQIMLEAERFAKNYSISSFIVANDDYLEEEIVFYNRQGFNLSSDRVYEKKYYI